MTDLSDLEQRFVNEYVLDPSSISGAAARAGYSSENITGLHTVSSRVFNRPHVQAAIKAYNDAAAQRVGITKERILKELAIIAFAPVTGLTGKNEEGDDVLVVPQGPQAQEVTVTTTTGSRPQKTVKVGTVRLADKKSALDLLGKHLGIFSDKVEVTHKQTLLELIEESMKDEPEKTS